MPVVLDELPLVKARAKNALMLTCALSASVEALNSDRAVPREVLRRPSKPFHRVDAPALSPSFFRRLHRVEEMLSRRVPS